MIDDRSIEKSSILGRRFRSTDIIDEHNGLVEHPRRDFWVHHETTMEAAHLTVDLTVGLTVGFTESFTMASSMDEPVDPT